MSGSEMEVDENESGLYVRTLEDVKAIIKHAKLDERNLTQITQALYFPSSEIEADNLKLLELDDHLLQQIHAGNTLQFKGGLNEKVVICTEERTYDVKAAEISNSLLLVADLKFAAATSTSPLKSPRTGQNNSFERSLNDSTEDEELSSSRSLEQRKVLKIFHEYLECREIQPRFRKLYDLLQITRYSGPENEDFIDKKLLFSYDQLLDTIQCSMKQFEEGLKQKRAIEFEGHIRVLESEYEFRIINLMVGVVTENSWSLDEVEREETVAALDGIAPLQIVGGLFDLYTFPTKEKPGKYTYRENLVARIVAKNILQPGLKFRLEEFMSTWQETLPEGMKCAEKYFHGLGVFDREGLTSCIRSLAEENLSTNIHERMQVLFKTKSKWTLEEMEPYIDCFTTPSLTVSQLLAKYARSLTERGKRYYVPRTSENYSHRSGRTARASKDGITVMFMEPSELKNYSKLYKTLDRTEDLPLFPVSEKYFAAVKERVNLARDLDKEELKLRRSQSDIGWMKKTAEEMDTIIDGYNDQSGSDQDEDPYIIEKRRNRMRLESLRTNLGNLLAKPIFPKGFSFKYPTINTQMEKSEEFRNGELSAVKVMQKAIEERKIEKQMRNKKRKRT